MRGRFQRLRSEPERGQILVLFALFLVVLMPIGSIVLDIGNWHVLRRHMQTQVDAAALAAGPAFTGCFQTPGATTAAVRQHALHYAGDPTRDAATHNLLMQDSSDVHVVLNSRGYWVPGDPTDGSVAPGGSGDWTLGAPCATKYIDVKATDQDAPSLWGWLPFFPDPKTRARVEINQVEATDGLRPLGVPEVDPEQVAVLFVNEDGNPNDPNSVRGGDFLCRAGAAGPPACPTAQTGLEAFSVWHKDFIQDVGINGGENFGVIVVVSRSPNPISLNGTLNQICTQNPTQTKCYGGGTLNSGISFIHAYTPPDGDDGSASAPLIGGVTLDGGCPDDLSRPYFNLTARDENGSGCPFGITAEIDFGTGNNDPSRAVQSGGVCAEVTATPGGRLTWVNGVWTDGSFTLGAESGATVVNLTWTTDTNGGCGGNNNGGGSFPKVAKPHVANEASGPVQYLTVERSGSGLANSMGKDSDASLDVTVGFLKPLQDGPLTDPPIPLRFWDTPSQTQALDCGTGSSGWGEAMVNGCLDAYQIYDEAKHVSKCGPPPNGVPAADPADCISSQNGNYQQKDVVDMLTPCGEHPNRWDGMNIPPASDKRWMPLFIVDELAFKQSGKKTYPIRRFGMFYVTAASDLNCPGDNPTLAPKGKREMWGHFITYVTPGFGVTIPSDELCSFVDGSLCVSNLVE